MGILGVALAVTLWALWPAMRPAETPSQPAVRLDFDLGPDVSLRSGMGPSVIISPDGSRLVIISQGQDGVRRLFTRRLDDRKLAALSGTEGAYAPFFPQTGSGWGFLQKEN